MNAISLFDREHVYIAGLPFVTINHLQRFPQHRVDQIRSENKELISLSYHLTGGAIFFETNATKIVFDITYESEPVMNHMSLSGEAGFDIYLIENNEYVFYECIRPFPRQKKVTWHVSLPEKTQNVVMIYTPLYMRVLTATMLIENTYWVKPYIHQFNKRILWYGTSITQGACASRPGMMYTNIVSRLLNIEIINFGFSGNGLGELSVGEVIHDIKHLDSVIIDYEANAGSSNKLRTTLLPWIEMVRKKHPTIPIIVVSRIPFIKDRWYSRDYDKRCEDKMFQKTTVDLNRHLHPLYFIDGETLIHKLEYDVTVDGIHLNDVGMMLFAQRITPIINSYINNGKI